MIILKDITLAYSKDYNALMDINLEVQKGEKLGIVGPSGCGKTALLRLIAGLDFQKSGEAYIKDTPIKKINFARDVSLGYLTQNAIFYERKTVYKNLEWALKVRKIDKQEIEPRIYAVLKEFDITHLKNEKINTLCKSDRRLIQIARLALRKVEILLCDDIFVGIEDNNKEKIKKALHKLIEMEPKDKIVIFASGEEEVCKEFTNKILHINMGSFVEKQNEE